MLGAPGGRPHRRANQVPGDESGGAGKGGRSPGGKGPRGGRGHSLPSWKPGEQGHSGTGGRLPEATGRGARRAPRTGTAPGLPGARSSGGTGARRGAAARWRWEGAGEQGAFENRRPPSSSAPRPRPGTPSPPAPTKGALCPPLAPPLRPQGTSAPLVSRERVWRSQPTGSPTPSGMQRCPRQQSPQSRKQRF